MKTFTPGVIVHEFIGKNGEEIIIRFPERSDVDDLTRYINAVSKEDTFITFSGEQIVKEEELVYLEDQITKMDSGDAVLLMATVNGAIIGSAGVNRKESSRSRGKHIGIFGISLAKEYRGQGIGYELATCTIQEAKFNIDNMRLITLTVYEPNVYAQRLYKKLGFKEYGKLPKGIWYRDQYVDEIEMYLEIGS
jgi:RimJ/RimL family protein N-acetyltransferase